MNFINKIQRFMYGRYGFDDLYKFLIKIYFIIFIINIFLKNYIIDYVELFLVVIIIFRSLSKNINRRSKENALFLKIKNKILNIFKKKNKYKNDKDHIYKKCHHCKTILKLPLPRKRGIKHSKCPTCKKRNTFLILRKEKIEVILNTGGKNAKNNKKHR